ncbi:DNA-3-methyladenine glycosylase [Pseudomonas sp. L5B5]|uniref:DNA-3-methyladenine glycosylase family protein n=1 Tax=Pseudomonas sp. L5B5 TaxID=2883205 RepID=UPI001CFB4A10|nr:DNA-3-methyladenine glycosylase [Pseudomonas sp. L5B5]UCZ85076.1 DNA-3-methyladenine glycosylase [Pseudomonas sp. L5B5]
MPASPDVARTFLTALDADWARHIAAIGPCLHQPRPEREPYQALVRAVAYQQLHAKAGDAILARLRALFPDQAFPSPQQLCATRVEQLRECGFSARKAATLLGIAQATLEGHVPSADAARELDDEQLVERLTQLPGIGRWTVEMLLIYSLERQDVLPVDDFGVREGYRRLKGLEQQPSPRQMRELGLAWSPWRTTAAWYLWRVPAP